MKTEIINPVDGIYPATQDYVHAIKIIKPTEWLFISGTMGLNFEGKAVSNINEQLELIWSNIRTILKSADLGAENIIKVTSYLRDKSYIKANQEARVRALNGCIVPTTTIIAQTLDSQWLVETEIIAAG